jgi:SHS2 domain-containing protein
MCSAMYEWREHTAELELVIEAESEEALFEEALRAFRELVERGDGEPARHEVRAEGNDRATLLAAWLEELIFLAETHDFVPERTVSLDLGSTALQASVEGRRDAPAHLVKAVTYHGLAAEPFNGGWRACLVLDV